MSATAKFEQNQNVIQLNTTFHFLLYCTNHRIPTIYHYWFYPNLSSSSKWLHIPKHFFVIKIPFISFLQGLLSVFTCKLKHFTGIRQSMLGLRLIFHKLESQYLLPDKLSSYFKLVYLLVIINFASLFFSISF